ncbi:MAG TPA: hypothetical protein VNC61_12775 [Acidimicrobiales bacterium]|nr:hypothetical protein [Acidimicrobiales bacterium]
MSLRQFEIEVPAPFRLDLTVWALRRRPHNTVDSFDGTRYRRTLMVKGRALEIAVRQDECLCTPRLAVELRCSGAGPNDASESEARRLLHRILGLGVDIEGFYRLAERDARLTELAARFSGMRPPRFPTVFEALVNAIACQQLSLTVGIHLLNRLAARYGPTTATRTGTPAGFPAPGQLADADPQDLRALGFSRSKAQAIRSVAGQVAMGELDLETLDGVDDDNVRAVLREIRGIGRWSAEYTLLRGLGRLHVLPGDDVGARNNLRRRFALGPSAGYDEISKLSRSWWPYGGLVYFHLLLDALAEGGHVAPAEALPLTTPPRHRSRGAPSSKGHP